MLKKRSAYRVLARRASGAHVLNGPVMLHRMAKRVRAAEHHFCHPVASRCGRSTGRALQRPPRPRFASARRVLLTKVGLSHRPARTVACCVGEVRPVAERHAFGHPRPPSRCHPMGGTGRSHRGLSRRCGRSLPAKPCVPEWDGPTRWSAQYRSASDRRVNWLGFTARLVRAVLNTRTRPWRRCR